MVGFARGCNKISGKRGGKKERIGGKHPYRCHCVDRKDSFLRTVSKLGIKGEDGN